MLFMEIALAVLAFLFLLIGLLGSVVPALPGPPLSFAGLLLLQWSGYGNFTPAFLWIWAGITAAVTVLDNVLPAIMTKRFGGSRTAVIGSIVGLVIGMIFFAPAGILLGPFLGALAGELINSYIRNRNTNSGTDNFETDKARLAKALKVAMGAFLAFIFGTGAKLIVVSVMIFYAVKAILEKVNLTELIN